MASGVNPMAQPGKDEQHRHDRPAHRMALYIVAIGAVGAVAGLVTSRGLKNQPLLVVGILIPLVLGVGAAAGIGLSRSMARRAGVPRKLLRPLLRRVRREDVPEDPQEQAAMGRIVAAQREAVQKPPLPRWAYRALALVFVAGAVLRILNGSLLMALVLSAAAALQLCQPLLTRRALGRLDRVAAELRHREQGPA